MNRIFIFFIFISPLLFAQNGEVKLRHYNSQNSVLNTEYKSSNLLANRFDIDKSPDKFIGKSSGVGGTSKKLDTYKGGYSEEDNGDALNIFGINIQSLVILVFILSLMFYFKKRVLDKEEDDDFRERF